MTRTWWVARDSVLKQAYFVGPKKPEYRQTIPGRGFFQNVPGNFGMGLHLCAATWHRAGGLRLKPGEGPIQVTLELKVRRVR